MILPTIYFSLHFLTVVLLFIKLEQLHKYKNIIIRTNIILFILLLIDIFLINLKGALLDRVLVITFLITGSLSFALYSRSLKPLQKLYFGSFLFYPIIAALTFLIDRIMFIGIASPLLVTLTVPESKFNTDDYELREISGVMGPVQIALIEKSFITEKYLGVSNEEQIKYKIITDLDIIHIDGDTTFTLLKAGDKTYTIAFYK